MFTGLVETLAPVIKIVDQPPGKRIVVSAPEFREASPAADVQLGDSIAINGCCLTIVDIDEDLLAFEAGEETLSRTNLGRLAAGQSYVNLERSLAVGDRMGGHYVTGHVDGIGTLVERVEDPPWANLKFELPCSLTSQIVGKGSITVDGISLTVVDVGENFFTVALIPHTLEVTSLGKCDLGSEVNLETDLLAKYVEKSMKSRVLSSSEATNE